MSEQEENNEPVAEPSAEPIPDSSIESVTEQTDITGRDVMQTGLDLVAGHYLADTIRPGEDKKRALYGGLTAATFYAVAPWIKKKFGDLGDLSAEDFTKKDVAIVGGLAGLGTLAGYLWKPDEQPLMRIPEVVSEGRRPRPIVIGASALYLAASLIDPSRSAEFKTRQRAGLLAGLIAYTTGPELAEKTMTYLSPNDNSLRTRRMITTGLAAGTGGALIRYVTK